MRVTLTYVFVLLNLILLRKIEPVNANTLLPYSCQNVTKTTSNHWWTDRAHICLYNGWENVSSEMIILPMRYPYHILTTSLSNWAASRRVWARRKGSLPIRLPPLSSSISSIHTNDSFIPGSMAFHGVTFSKKTKTKYFRSNNPLLTTLHHRYFASWADFSPLIIFSVFIWIYFTIGVLSLHIVGGQPRSMSIRAVLPAKKFNFVHFVVTQNEKSELLEQWIFKCK